MAGLTRDFPTPNVLASRAESHQLCWILRKDGICKDMEEVLPALRKSCTAFCRAFGTRAAATKIFIIQLSSRARRQLPDSNFPLGIRPDSIKGGEEVWAASGTELPFILKRHPRQEAYHVKDGEEVAPTTYHLHGIMHGELFESRAPEWQQIILE